MMGFQISLSDIFILVGLFLTGFGLLFAAVQIRQNNISRRAEIMLTVVERYFSSAEERKMYYKIDYDKFKFNPKKFRGSTDERALDGILYNLHLIGRLLRIGAISIEEIRLLDFEIFQILNNPEVNKYLDWLDEEIETHGIIAEPSKEIKYLKAQLIEKSMKSQGFFRKASLAQHKNA